MRKELRNALLGAVVSIAALTSVPGAAHACSCMWAGGFLAVAPKAELIVRARVVEYHGRNRKVDLAMDIEVLEVLKGTSMPARATLRVWGDNGALCRPYVSAFARGTEWIFAIRPLAASREPEAARGGDFYIPGCGAYWLRVDADRARGHIHGGAPGTPAQEESLETIRQALGPRRN
jgi:hypothetical protein